MSPIFLRNVSYTRFYTAPSSSSALFWAEQGDTKSVEKQKGGNDVYPFARRILTRAAHDEEEARRPKMASVTLVCYAIQHVHERLSKIARMPPRIGHCNQLSHSSLSVCLCVRRFRYAGPAGWMNVSAELKPW